jgi:hypothetical protein
MGRGRPRPRCLGNQSFVVEVRRLKQGRHFVCPEFFLLRRLSLSHLEISSEMSLRPTTFAVARHRLQRCSRTNRERWSPRSKNNFTSEKNPSRFDAWRLAVPQKSYSSVIATPDRIPNVTTAANTRADVLHDIVRPTISIG